MKICRLSFFVKNYKVFKNVPKPNLIFIIQFSFSFASLAVTRRQSRRPPPSVVGAAAAVAVRGGPAVAAIDDLLLAYVFSNSKSERIFASQSCQKLANI